MHLDPNLDSKKDLKIYTKIRVELRKNPIANSVDFNVELKIIEV